MTLRGHVRFVRAAVSLFLSASLAALLGCAAQQATSRDLGLAHYRLGEAQLQKGKGLDDELNRRQAYSEFIVAVENDPDNPLYRVGLGTIFFYDGKLDQAELQFREALRLDPNNAEAHNSLGSVLSRRGRFKEAIVEYDAALENHSYMTPQISYFNKGQAFFQMQEWQNAANAFQAALEINPGIELAWQRMGVSLDKLNRTIEAEKALRHAVEILPASAPNHYQLGLILSRQKKNDEATVEFKKVMELDPDGEFGKNAARYLGIIGK